MTTLEQEGACSIRFDNRVAIVTGAGGGLGRAYALELARRGAQLVINDLPAGGAVGASGGPADAVVDEIRAAGGTAVACHASVASADGGDAIVAGALEAFGRLDILVSNAGILRSDRFDEVSDADLDDVLAVNL